MGDKLRKRRHGMRRGSGASWNVDETYLKFHRHWYYLYRAVDPDGNLIDATLSDHHNMKAEGLLPLDPGNRGVPAETGDDGWA